MENIRNIIEKCIRSKISKISERLVAMPELPEVETIRAGLNHYLKGKTILAVSSDTPKLFPNDVHLVNMHLLGSKVEAVRRRGKAMIVHLSTGYALVIHLKMTGQMIYVGKETKDRIEESMPGRFTHIIFSLSDEAKLYYNDMRKFGWIKLMPLEEVEELPFLKEMGAEPLSTKFTTEYLAKKLQKKSVAVKAAILDQKVVAGVGNIYADESLFLSGIMPSRPADSLSTAEVKKLCSNIKKVLKHSIDLGGSTRKDYVNAIGQKGDYLDEAYVYGRAGEPCRRCDSPIEKIKLAGRGTHFCRQCQK